MKRLTIALAAAALATAALAPAAQAAFGLNNFHVAFEEEDGSADTQAGSHPFAITTSFGINFHGEGAAALPDGEIKDLTIAQVPGLVGDPTAVPRCSTAVFLAREEVCAAASQVGSATYAVNLPGGEETSPVYSLAPPPGVPLRLGFKALGLVPVVIDVQIAKTPPYEAVAVLRNVRQTLKLYDSSLTLFGSHEGKAFLTLPTSCEGPGTTAYETLSWQGATDAGSAQTPGMSGCGKLGFLPQISSQATTGAAESASGLDFAIDFHDEGLSSPTGLAQSTMKETVVKLPPGVTANPSVAEGLATCSLAQVGMNDRGEANENPAACPDASKIGSVQTTTPLLEEAIDGSVYLATPNDPATSGHENPFDSLLAFYIVLANPNLGIQVKLAAEVKPDPVSGQLITTVKEIPQLPVSRFSFHFNEGRRAPLITPPACGTYTTEARFTPWARPGEPVTATASFAIERGVGGGPCPPGGTPPFHPAFTAGSINNNAATYSPFVMRLTRADGEQDMTRFAAVLPPGVTGKLAGVDKCPEAQIALAKSKSASAELASPSCPANSKIGTTLAAAGVGEALTYVPGSLYLAGPYHGDPLSVVAVTPAKAGPFDVGTVVVRDALAVNPKSAQVSVDPSASDPIPHVLAGIPLHLRELRVSADRPNFTLNPTSCDPQSALATLWGSYLNLLNPAASSPEVPVALQDRYQTAGCQGLGFKPSLALRLKGGTKRGKFPQLRGTYTPRQGDANLKSLVVRLPHSAFLEQGHFKTICTRVQYAAKACPAGSVYGHVTATTPLLSEPLEGPIYLRSSNHNLPDMVISLHGIVDFEAVARIDSKNGGIRSSFSELPDVPISKVIVNLQGGKKGLIVNSTNICKAKHRADVRFSAQSAKGFEASPVVRAQCGKKR